MNFMDKIFSIETLGHITKFENHSKFIIILDEIAKKPKRKHKSFCLIPPGQSRILDPYNQESLDFTKISIRFENEQ